MNNLWNLKDIKKNIKNSPNSILEEQAKYFEKNLDSVLYAKIQNTRISEDDTIPYKLATKFSIVSPVLDNYTYILFWVYSNPESNYPVMISVNDYDVNEDDDEDLEINDCKCNNEEEFIKALRDILGSDKTTETISVLYSKSLNY